MKRVFIIADTMISPLGKSSEENFNNLVIGKSGIQKQSDGTFASRIDSNTRFENICVKALNDLRHKIDWNPERTLLLLSTTKGNVLQELLHETANKIALAVNINQSQVISNACSSGVAALLVAKRMLQSSQFDHIVVVGADVLSDFVTSGFKSLMALSDELCRPFDATRKGINLGEAVGAVVLSANDNKDSIAIVGGAMTNDANHISGPSRTGIELASAITKAMQGNDIDFISAHGTATLFNDEMEAKAFHHAGVDSKPLHSLKGYFGHTLGAAGVIETIMCIQMLKQQMSIASIGYKDHGVSLPLNICTISKSMPLKRILKTASGFGGTNASIILST